jgi:hypothetical protein
VTGGEHGQDEARVHDLKTLPPYFAAVLRGQKTFEVRRDDRSFDEGDVLVLREWSKRAQKYTGRELRRVVTYLLDGGQFGIEAGYVVMGLAEEAPGG